MAVEAIVGPIVEAVVSLAADAIAGRLRVAWGLEGGLRKLQRLLLRIQSVLADAEEKQTVDAAVRMWLNALKKVAYEAEDVLDELNYETLRDKAAEVAPGNKTLCSGKVRDFFSSHNPLFIRLRMGRKLSNCLEEINKLADESTKFNFSNDDQSHHETAAPVIDETCSFVEESQVVGRRGQKDEIVELLINEVSHNAGNVAVLPIVGMGGLGKTTLAQLIYNDTRVVAYFELRAWVYVSDPWDAKKIIQEILSLAGRNCESSSMEGLHLAFKETLAQKRFVIVLDDVWEEDPTKWGTLKGLINCGRKGSTVIVTTRSDRVSEITGTLKSYPLPYLSEDESWDLFSKRAFAPGFEKPKELVEIGKAIANKCKGLPLALRMLGSLLYMKTDRSQWLKIKESDIWNTETESGILPALRLSYKHLPLHSKRCFAFCAIFPKDYEIDKEMLINMWMAHGFIPSHGRTLEIKGNEIFNQLVQRSFFQDLKEEMMHGTIRMHDLIHDLALSIAGNDCVGAQGKPSEVAVIKDAYHLFLSVEREFDIKHMLKVSPFLRTVLSTMDTWLTEENIKMNVSGSTFLRVLVLRAQRLRLPSSMKHLRHLRYLQLWMRELSELPESICALLNLQTLDLSGCVELRRLPKRMRCMFSLRHLYLDGCYSLEEMAPGMGRMTNLQALTRYVVGEESERGIGELKGLHLSSRLVLRNLGSVKDAKEAREVNLHSKNLVFLALDWTSGPRRLPVGEGRGRGGISNVEQVLEELKPPCCLKFLEIWGYAGLKFPTWMADRLLLQHLVQLNLYDCTGLHWLPPLWQLSSLEVLYLRHMDNLKCIISDGAAAGGTTVQTFPSLKKLELTNLGSLVGWWENKVAPLREAMANCFPALHHLVIAKCPEMAGSLSVAPRLKSLMLNDCMKIQLGSINALTSLVSLNIATYQKELVVGPAHAHDPVDSFLPHETLALGHLHCLEELSIRSPRKLPLVWGLEDGKEEEGPGNSSLKRLMLCQCDWIFSSPRCYGLWTGMTSLERLSISDCHALPSDQVFQILKSLIHLEIKKCTKLKSLALNGLTALRSLELEGCTDLTSVLPERVVLPALEELIVVGCQRLEQKCARGGEYWSLIANIPSCLITGFH